MAPHVGRCKMHHRHCTWVFFDKKPAKKAPSKKGDSSFLDGGGSRITIRDDEDAAMWVEEPKPKPAPKNKSKK